MDDVLRLEELNAVVPSPDGKYVAIEIARPLSDVARVHMTAVDARPRTDIWLVRLSDGKRQQLTHGSRTGSGWFHPVWSPDGTRLAMLSTDGCSCFRAWTWRLGDSAPRLVDSRSVDFWVFAGETGLESDLQPLVWLSETTLLMPLLPAGGRAHVDLVAEAESATIAGWRAQRVGRVSTASVLESIPGAVQPYLGDESIVIADVERHTTRVLATIPRDPTTSGRRVIVVSPDHRRLAVLTSRLESPRAGQGLTRTMSVYALGLVDVSGRDTVRWIADVRRHGATGEDMPVPAWTPNGEGLLLRGKWNATGRWEPGLWRIDALTGRITRTACPATMPQCSARQAASAARPTTVVTDTALYRVARDGHRVDLLPPSLRRPTLRLQQFGLAGDGNAPPCVIATLDDGKGQTTAYRVIIASDAATTHSLGVLPFGYYVRACVPHTDGVIVERRDRAVAWLESGHLVTLFEINAWSDGIAEPRKVLLHYAASDGAPLTGLLLLPAAPSTGPDESYPLIVWVYAGMTFGDTAAMRADHAWSSPYNLALATARGYAVLYPSIPLAPQGSDGPVAPHLTGAVLPAIDRVGALGVVDTSRVAVMGQSFGGWTTLALITRTERFRSAIALAAVSDQLSYSGTFRPWDRPWPYAHTVIAPGKMVEAGQQSLEGPLWEYPEQYIEDSPVLQANRVGTPTMIIQGDQDFEGIQQGEEFFSALYRLGKRATFVRYIGDTHAIESPANVRDMWQRMFAWLSTTLGKPGTDTSRAAPN
ncbi:MAG TPA: prolyl oligopeptidase family serine peptidase [Gemmatimonadaceae bacterium]